MAGSIFFVNIFFAFLSARLAATTSGGGRSHDEDEEDDDDEDDDAFVDELVRGRFLLPAATFCTSRFMVSLPHR